MKIKILEFILEFVGEANRLILLSVSLCCVPPPRISLAFF